MNKTLIQTIKNTVLKVLLIIMLMILLIDCHNAELSKIETIYISCIFVLFIILIIFDIILDIKSYKALKKQHDSWQRFNSDMKHLTPKEEELYNNAINDLYTDIDVDLFELSDEEVNKSE